MGFSRQVLIVSSLVLIVSLAIHIALRLDLHKRVYNHRPGRCQQVPGVVHGSEDIAIVESLGIAFVSSGVRYILKRPQEVEGKIFLYDFNDPEVKVVELPLRNYTIQNHFSPHGLAHWETESGVRLFVIHHSHPGFKHSVEVFMYDHQKKELVHEKSIEDDKFIRPNGLVAVGPDSFILTNDGTSQTELGNLVEMVTGFSFGSIVYYDGEESHLLLSSAVSPNGIEVSKKHDYLIVSHVNEEKIGIYRLAKNYKSVELVRKIDLLTAIDNFYLDPHNGLWTGAHPIAYEAMAHLGKVDDLNKKSSSQVLRIQFNDDFSQHEIFEPFTDDGSLISGSSAAVYMENQLLIGSIGRQLVHCHVVDLNTIGL